MNVSSRVISIPRSRNPFSLGSESRSAGSDEAISRSLCVTKPAYLAGKSPGSFFFFLCVVFLWGAHAPSRAVFGAIAGNSSVSRKGREGETRALRIRAQSAPIRIPNLESLFPPSAFILEKPSFRFSLAK
jgi:hypothetical protein